MLGSLLGLPGFDFATIDEVRASLPAAEAIAGRLANGTRRGDRRRRRPPPPAIERVADVPIHFADPLVRRAPSLQQTADAAPPRARMSAATLQALGVAAGAQVRVRQGRGEAVLPAAVDAAVPDGVVRIAAAHASTCALEGLSGPIEVAEA